MKYTNFILILVLYLGVSSNIFAMQESSNTPLIPQTQSTFYSLYHGMVTSITNMISSWNERKNALIATAAIAAILINYKSAIDWLNNRIVRPTEQGKELSKQIRVLSEKEYQEEINKPKQPWTKKYYEMLLQKQLEQPEREQQK